MVKKCLLKRFGILEVNKYVAYRVHPNPDLLYIYFRSKGGCRNYQHININRI